MKEYRERIQVKYFYVLQITGLNLLELFAHHLA
jgi:hypothetical protein